MISLICRLPKNLTVALSGGVDSVAVVDFLSQKHDVSCAFFHHGTADSERALAFVEKFCYQRDLPLYLGVLNATKPKNNSQEEFWRIQRYRFLESLNTVVVTAHNLDDCVETYLYSSLHGQSKVIPWRRNNIIRPFLITPKSKLVNWCKRKNITWCEDLSNQDLRYMRNYIRHELMSHALRVNPGLSTVVKKIVKKTLCL